MKKRLINRRLIVAGISSALAYPAVAQEVYPARSVRIIVPFAAGGGADAVHASANLDSSAALVVHSLVCRLDTSDAADDSTRCDYGEGRNACIYTQA